MQKPRARPRRLALRPLRRATPACRPPGPSSASSNSRRWSAAAARPWATRAGARSQRRRPKRIATRARTARQTRLAKARRRDGPRGGSGQHRAPPAAPHAGPRPFRRRGRRQNRCCHQRRRSSEESATRSPVVRGGAAARPEAARSGTEADRAEDASRGRGGRARHRPRPPPPAGSSCKRGARSPHGRPRRQPPRLPRPRCATR
mmetsp:Transcript_12039/g.39322  ORF Transcript_12039/g.39322 Transcript_12039/m.39322 type:complete len:204 (-) Transcript_12039:2119-2730(-)